MKMRIGVWVLLSGIMLIAGCGGVAKDMTAEEAFTKGNELLEDGDRNKAYKYFEAAAKKDPQEPRYSWAAAQSAPDQNAAFVHVESAWKNGLKNPSTLALLARLSFHTDKRRKMEYALDLFSQLPDSLQKPELRGDIFFRYGELDSSIALWMPLYYGDHATPSLCFKLANAYQRTGNAGKARELLEHGRRGKLLEAPGYAMLATLHALDYAYDEAGKVYEEAKARGHYTKHLHLEHATFLMAQGKLDKAEQVLENVLRPAQGDNDSAVNIRARLLTGYIASDKKEPQRLDVLREMSEGDDPVHKAERSFYDALQLIMSDSTDALESFQSFYQHLAGAAAVDLVYARQRAKAGDYERAIVLYRSLPALLLRSPTIVVELAAAQAKSGDVDKALGTLSAMHVKGTLSKASLELFRDLAFRKQIFDKSKAAQAVLEEKYSDDAGVRYAGAMLALRENKVDTAIAILTKLAKDYPREAQFEIARISAIAVKGDYDRVIREADAGSAPKHLLAGLKARAYRRKGDLAGAEKALNDGLKQKRTPKLLLEYADILMVQEKHTMAAEVYQEIMTEHEERLSSDSIGNAMLLNNFAWAQISDGNIDDQVLDAARKAHELSPSNPHILDTYATGLIKSAKWKECIQLLENDSVAAGEPRLLFHLATALEKRNQINRAVRTYREAYEMSDSSATLPLGISRKKLSSYIDGLIER
ncbi:MAG: hypothetical protein GF344_05330 [Chitinivibrionales bacterium]|nr:hypothetical protein [Chitinivibrionales bacterium]MBD3356410.1 hypothetical protein [Chitinivibrionales bacterium]